MNITDVLNIARSSTVFLLVVGSLFSSNVFAQNRKATRSGSVSSINIKKLSAKEIAMRVLPSVVLVVCDDGKGRTSLGSGFYVTDGIIVTNFHVIRGMTRGVVQMAVGTKKEKQNYRIARVLGFDEESDLAILNTPSSVSEELPKLGLENVSPPEIGDVIYALGNPEGLNGTISPGIVSAALRSAEKKARIQITAPISKGSSGGPLVDQFGRVVGVVVGSVTDGQNLNFAIPVGLLNSLIKTLNFPSQSQTFGDQVEEDLQIRLDKRFSTVNAAPRDWIWGLRAKCETGTKVVADADVRKSKIGIELVWIPPGDFLMGTPTDEAGDLAETPQHRVTFRRGFWMGRFEVTQDQWQTIMGDNPSLFNNCGGDWPVEQVSWDDVQVFLRRLNSRDTEYEYRLPSEAEWEYAARAGTTTEFAFGDSIDLKQANFENLPYASIGQTARVGSYKPNTWGLSDMHGNVREWVQDVYSSTYDGLPADGSPNTKKGDAGDRMVRGGSYSDRAWNLRSASRAIQDPTMRWPGTGFRVLALPK